MSKLIPLAVAGSVLALTGGTFGAAQAFAKDVTLVVDGVPTQVRVLDATVAQVLIDQHISLAPHDVVTPAVTDKVGDGSVVTVNFARPVTVTVDGRTETRWTTATTVSDVLSQFALRADNGNLSVSRSMTIGREGAAFALETAKKVTVTTKDGATPVELLGTVADALAKSGVTVDSDDKVAPALDTVLTDGMAINVTTVDVRRYHEIVVLPFTSEKKDWATLPKGTTEVETPGQDGKVVEVWEEVSENGVPVSKAKVADDSRTEPVTEVILVGTKLPDPEPVAAPVAPSAATPVVPTPGKTAPAPAPAPVPAPPVYSGGHTDWMAAAGIAPSDYGYVEKLIQKESSWNPNAVNSSSGACGLVQALPCSKLGPNWNNPVVALQWGNSYVAGRYGGWAGAWAHSLSYGWY